MRNEANESEGRSRQRVARAKPDSRWDGGVAEYNICYEYSLLTSTLVFLTTQKYFAKVKTCWSHIADIFRITVFEIPAT